MINDLKRGQHQRRLHHKPKSFWGPRRPPDPRQNSLSLLHQTLPCEAWGRENEEKPFKPFLSDILLILRSVMGITIIKVKIISLYRKSSKVSEVKKSLATYAFMGEMASKR